MRVRWVLVGCSLLLCGCAAPLPFAPDIEKYAFEADRDLSGVWSKEGVEGYARRIRLTVRPSLVRANAVIRIDVPESGPAVGYAVIKRTGVHDSKITERRTFIVRSGELDKLDTLIARSGLWKFEKESWIAKSKDGEDLGCIDGVQLVFERATKDGYHFSEANAWCTASSELLQVAKQMIDLAGLEKSGVTLWLP